MPSQSLFIVVLVAFAACLAYVTADPQAVFAPYVVKETSDSTTSATAFTFHINATEHVANYMAQPNSKLVSLLVVTQGSKVYNWAECVAGTGPNPAPSTVERSMYNGATPAGSVSIYFENPPLGPMSSLYLTVACTTHDQDDQVGVPVVRLLFSGGTVSVTPDAKDPSVFITSSVPSTLLLGIPPAVASDFTLYLSEPTPFDDFYSVVPFSQTDVENQLFLRILLVAAYKTTKLEAPGISGCGEAGGECSVRHNCGRERTPNPNCFRGTGSLSTVEVDKWRCVFDPLLPALPVTSGCTFSVKFPYDNTAFPVDPTIDTWTIFSPMYLSLGVSVTEEALVEMTFPAELESTAQNCNETQADQITALCRVSSNVIRLNTVAQITEFYSFGDFRVVAPVPMPWSIKWTGGYPHMGFSESGEHSFGFAEVPVSTDFNTEFSVSPFTDESGNAVASKKIVEYFMSMDVGALNSFTSMVMARFANMNTEASCTVGMAVLYHVYWPFAEAESPSGTGIGSEGVRMRFPGAAVDSAGLSKMLLRCVIDAAWDPAAPENDVFVTLHNDVKGMTMNQKLVRSSVGTGTGFVDHIVYADGYKGNWYDPDVTETVEDAVKGNSSRNLLAYKGMQTAIESPELGNPDFNIAFGMRVPDTTTTQHFLEAVLPQRIYNTTGIIYTPAFTYHGAIPMLAMPSEASGYSADCRSAATGQDCVIYSGDSGSYTVLDQRACLLADDSVTDAGCLPKFTNTRFVRNGYVDDSFMMQMKSLALNMEFSRARIDNWFIQRTYRAVVTFPEGFTRTLRNHRVGCGVSGSNGCGLTIVGNTVEISFTTDLSDVVGSDMIIGLNVTTDFIADKDYNVELTAIFDEDGTNYLENAPVALTVTVPLNVIPSLATVKALRTDDATVVFGNYSSSEDLMDGSQLRSFIVAANGEPVSCSHVFTVGTASKTKFNELDTNGGSSDEQVEDLILGAQLSLTEDIEYGMLLNNTRVWTVGSSPVSPLPSPYNTFERFPFVVLVCDPVAADATVSLDGFSTMNMVMHVSSGVPVETVEFAEVFECARMAGTIQDGSIAAITDALRTKVVDAFASAFSMIASPVTGDAFASLTETTVVARVCAARSGSNAVEASLSLGLLAAHARDYLIAKVLDFAAPHSAGVAHSIASDVVTTSYAEWDFKCLDAASVSSSRGSCALTACSNDFVAPPVCWFGAISVSDEECAPVKSAPVLTSFCTFPVSAGLAEDVIPDQYMVTWEDVNGFALSDTVDARVSLIYPAPADPVVLAVVPSSAKKLTFRAADVGAPFGAVRAEVFIRDGVSGVSTEFDLEPTCVIVPCLNGGVCDHNTSVCACSPGWSGDTCATSVCDDKDFPCATTGGKCVVSSEGAAQCQCFRDTDDFPLFSGTSCETAEVRCSADPAFAPCGNGGVRAESVGADGRIVCGECACEGAWTPASDCKTCGHTCFNRGTVSDDCDACECRVGFRSDQCQCRHALMSFVVLADKIPFATTSTASNPVTNEEIDTKMAVFVSSFASELAFVADIPFAASHVNATASVSPKGTRYYTVSLMVGPDCAATHGDVADADMLPMYNKLASLKLILADGGHRSGADFATLATMHDKSGFSANDPNCKLGADICPSGWAGKGIYVDESAELDCNGADAGSPACQAGGPDGKGDVGSSKDGLSTGAIVGIAVGGSVFVIIIIAVAVAAAKGLACFAASQSSSSGVEMTSV